MTKFDFTNTPGLEAFIRRQIAQAVEAERAKSEKRIAELEAALKPFAELSKQADEPHLSPVEQWFLFASSCVTYGDLRAARSAIKAEGESKEFVRLGVAAVRVVANCESAGSED